MKKECFEKLPLNKLINNNNKIIHTQKISFLEQINLVEICLVELY